MHNQLVSIIIPTYNRGHLISETLDSVLAQTYTNWECIVVDDGSTDNTDEILANFCKKDSRIHFYHRPKDRLPGGNAARNYGFELSKGEYVNWFDSDDLMISSKLEKQMNLIAQTNSLMSICNYEVFEDNIDNVVQHKKEKIQKENAFWEYLNGNLFIATITELKNKFFLQTNNLRFDEELMAAQEWEFNCRVLFCIEDYAYIDETLVKQRHHSDSISNSESIEYEIRRQYHYFLARAKLRNKLNLKGIENYDTFFKNYYISKYLYFIEKRRICLSLKVLIVIIKVIPNSLNYLKLLFYSGMFFLFKIRRTRLKKILINL